MTRALGFVGRVVTPGSPINRNADLSDVGVVKIVRGMLPPFPAVQKFAMDFEYLSERQIPRSGKHYAIVGFPASRSSVNPITRTASVSVYTYRSDSVPDDAYRRHGFFTGVAFVTSTRFAAWNGL
jgi:hypothetical protein